ncbi:MAG TPA: hypothetical protein VH054_21070 [Polyangiaceae bacterium]|jgi:hypothetical protein|nr:hypothetical protein [Polyangiaceae bacterium]
MGDTDQLRKVAEHHHSEAQTHRKKGAEYHKTAEKADLAGKKRAAKEFRAMGDAELKIAASQHAEGDRLKMMADIYDEVPEE